VSRIALYWLLLNLFTIVVSGFYSMLEMACVSFNKVRLQYYVSTEERRAIWLSHLLQNPSRLFGTTLIGVNVAMFAGSECARQFHEAIGLNPNLAPLSQVLLVVIFGELAPMFAARHHPEHVVMLGIPIIYVSAKAMAPFVWILSGISRLAARLIGTKGEEEDAMISREEIEKILETPHEGEEMDEYNAIASNIFRLHGKDGRSIMLPLLTVPMLPSTATVAQVQDILKRTSVDVVPLYHKQHANIIGIASPKDLLRASDAKRARDFSKPPWFVTARTQLPEILTQFRRNNQAVAVVLDRHGVAIGIVTLKDLLEEIFGKGKKSVPQPPAQSVLREITVLGKMKAADFNEQYGAALPEEEGETLSEIVIRNLGHPPEDGDIVTIGDYEIAVKECSLLEAKQLVISSKMR